MEAAHCSLCVLCMCVQELMEAKGQYQVSLLRSHLPVVHHMEPGAHKLS